MRAGSAAVVFGWALSAAVLLSGCGDDDVGDDGGGTTGYTDPSGASGTRLRRRYLEAGSGATKTMDFWDTELETSCSFRMAVDGAMRCLPTVYGDIYFADPGCTEPIYEAPLGVTNCQDAWGQARHTGAYYRVTSTPAVLSGGIFYQASESSCDVVPAAGDRAYWAAEHVTSASFVRGTRADEARTGGMVARYVDGEDGSRELLETVHGTRGYTCAFDDEGTCVPRVDTNVRYTDAACTSPIVEVGGTNEPALLPVFSRDASFCPTGVTYHERGAKLTLAEVYYRNLSGVCTPGSVSTLSGYYAMGAEIPLASLPRARLIHEGTGPLTARRYVDDEGAPLGSVHDFWDATVDEACEPGRVADTGDFVCLATWRGGSNGTYFADAACSPTMRVGVATCAASAPRVIWEQAVEACADVPDVLSIAAVYETGEVVGPDYYFENASVTCELRSFSGPTTGYRLGPDATSTLPALTLGVE